ncbi:MAG TPA: MFS transporter [Chloroflexia bacterium]|nr:MFS transporter [Chloroflexia bacterium]
MATQESTISAPRGLFGLSRFHLRLLWVSGIGWMFDAMDIGLLTFLLPTLIKDMGLTGQQPGLVVAFTFIGMFGGAALAGSLSDRYGRKAVFQWTLILYAIGTGLSAFAWDLPSLLVFRLIAGLGLGGELPVASTLVSEWSPPKVRGRMLVLLESFWAYGWTIAALIAFLLVPMFSGDTNIGWRVAFAIGALPALYVLYTRRALPESPRFLVSAGCTQEAQAALTEAARLAGDPRSIPTLDSFTQSTPTATRGHNWRTLWSGVLAKRTVMLWLLWFGMVYSYYGIFTWLPNILATKFTVIRGLEYNVIITIAQIPGYFTAAWLVEKLGRRVTLPLFLAGSALGAFLFRNAARPEELVAYGCVVSFFALGAWGVIYTYTPELYPTRIRGWGAGMAAAVGRIGGIFGPFITLSIVGNPPQPEGINVAFLIFTAIFLIIAANVALLGEETRGRSLEEITEF